MATELDREHVRRLVAGGAQLVEVLPTAAYEREPLAGAISLPLEALTRAGAARLSRDRPVIVYCADHQ